MHFPHTPESLLQRSDSKNPASTCRGLTADGRPCRRAISKSPTPSPSPRRASSPDGFCWQHREQVTPCATPTPKSRGKAIPPIREKNSIDSLVGRLGILEVEAREKERKREQRSRRKPVSSGAVGDDPDVPLQSIEHSPTRQNRKREKVEKREGGLLCCFGSPDNGPSASRPVKAQPGKRTNAALPKDKKVKSKHLHPNSEVHRPSIHRDPSSRTGEFLALIPASASPQLTAQLLAELAKPPSEYDDEGYIYMFWLTPESLPADPPSRTASTLLAPPSAHPPSGRRISEVLKTYSDQTSSKSTSAGKEETKTMLVKIGRAQNVHRRLHQWTRQCGYNLSLIRYYPYHPRSGGEVVPSTPPSKVPMATKVERLIHIELAPMRAKRGEKCEKCGREHREWFELEASREGVKSVDEVVRRWVGWAKKEIDRERL